MLETEDAIVKSVTIGASDTIVSLANYRKSIYIKNISTGGQIITISFSNNNPVVDNVGFVLGVGESIVESSSEGYDCWTGKIRAISDAVGGVITIVEQNEDLS